MPRQNAEKKPSDKPMRPPRSKEEALRQMAEKDPEKVAALLREILKKKP